MSRRAMGLATSADSLSSLPQAGCQVMTVCDPSVFTEGESFRMKEARLEKKT